MYVTLEVVSGEKIEDCAKAMCMFVMNTGISCGVDFNGVFLFCSRSTTYEELIKRYTNFKT